MISRKLVLFVLLTIALSEALPTQARAQAKRKNRPITARSAPVKLLSPTATLRAYYQAAINKDFNRARRYLSVNTVILIDTEAQRTGKSLDQVMREEARYNPTVMPRFSNERIRGATATVDIKTQGSTFTMPMVTENGVWKLAMDEAIEDMRRQKSTKDANATPSTPITTNDRVYTEDEKHRLFQTVGMLEDHALIIEVSQKIGIVDSLGQPKPNFQPFIKKHLDWAMRNADFIRQYTDKAKAREYVLANK